jgi:hypothetical protein
MSKSETMWVAFPNGGILPKDVTKSEERKVGPHEAVRVPRAYGKHLVDDRFAYETEEPKKAKDAGKQVEKPDLAELQDAVAQAEAAIAGAAEGEEKRLALDALDEAKAALAKAQG